MENLEFEAKTGLELPLSSLTSRNLAVNYLKSFAKILDFSSIDSSSHIHKTLFANDKRLLSAHKFLSRQRKSQKFFWKDENENKMDVINFYSTSSKQYCMQRKGLKSGVDIIKCKGVKRSVLRKSVSAKTFKRVTRNNDESKSAKIYGIRKQNFNLYLAFNKKRVLSLYTNKRFFRRLYSDNTQYFGFPIHFANVLR